MNKNKVTFCGRNTIVRTAREPALETPRTQNFTRINSEDEVSSVGTNYHSPSIQSANDFMDDFLRGANDHLDVDEENAESDSSE